MEITSHLLLVVLMSVVTSSAGVTSQNEWKPARWLNEIEPHDKIIKVQEIINASLAKLKQDLRDEFSLQMKNELNKLRAEYNQENQDRFQEINLKLTELDTKITHVQNNDLKSQVISLLTTVHSKEADNTAQKIHNNLVQINNNISEIIARHGEYDAFNKEITIKHKEFELLHSQIKNQTELRYQNIMENIKTLTDNQKSSTLKEIKDLETMKTEINNTIREQKQELVSLINELKKEVDVLRNSKISVEVKTTTISPPPVRNLNMVHLGGRSYHFSLNMSNWHDAQTFCRSHGLELAALETAEENRLVVEYRNKVVTGYVNTWIGGTDIDGEWRWSGDSGRPINFFNWHRTRKFGKFSPTNHCLGIHSRDVIGGTWCDWSCDSNINYICEGTPQ